MRSPRMPAGLSERVDAMMPMIDVVFLLLIFFLWSSSFQKPERELAAPPVLPASTRGTDAEGSPEALDFDEVVIAIVATADSLTYRLNDTELDGFADLVRRVEKIASLGVDVPVIVDPGGGVSVEQVVRVYDAVRSAGIVEVLLAVSEPAA